ncbi:MAG: PilZ domain-containing protein [Erythrobacter sp.]
MDFAASSSQITDTDNGADQRAAPRYTLLIRAAKLVSAAGEFVCVIRDISQSGVSVRLFHALPPLSEFELHMPAGAVYSVISVWQRDNEAGFSFAAPVDVDLLINEAGEYPKRGLRLGIAFPVMLTTISQSSMAMVENLSQQGALLACKDLFAIDQNVRIAGGIATPPFREVRAKVRWRRGGHYGVVFDDTFTLGDFARLAARLQAPTLLA